MNTMKPVYRNLIFLCFFFLAMSTIWYFGNLRAYINLTTIQQHRVFLFDYIHHFPFFSALLYIAIFFALTVSGLPITLIVTTIGGFLFGSTIAIFYTLIAKIASSVTVFYATKNMFGIHLQRKYAADLQKFNLSFERHGFFYLIFIRLIPLIPFFIVNVAAGLTRINLRIFITSTFLGILPSAIICSYLGSQCAALIVNC